MTKPALLRPRTIELIGGLVVVTLLAGLVISRSGPRQSNADQPKREAQVNVRDSNRAANDLPPRARHDAFSIEDAITAADDAQRPAALDD